MQFEIDQQCTIENINNRRGKNDESVVALDIKFSVETLSAEAVAGALAARSAGEVEQSFFAADKPRFAGMDVIPIDREFLGKHMIQIDDLENMRCTKLWKIRVLPLVSGSFGAEFQVTVEDPSKDFLHKVSNLNHRTVHIKLVQDVRELDIVRNDGDQAAADKKPGKVKKIAGAELNQPALH